MAEPSLDPERLALAAVGEVRALLACDGATVVWWDETQRVLVPLARHDPRATGPDPVLHPGQGVLGEVFRSGQSAKINAYDGMAWTNISSLLAVPLLVDGRPQGVLAGFHYDEQEHGEDKLAAIERVAADLAPALTGMKLLAAAQRRAAEASALAELMRSAVGAHGRDAVMGLVTEYAARLLGADLAGLVLAGSQDGDGAWRSVYGHRTDAWRERMYGREHLAAPTIFGGTANLFHGTPDLDPERFPFFAAEGIQTGLALPLGSPGSLVVGWRFSLHPAPAHVELGQRLADFATTLIDHAETEHERDLLVAHAPVVLASMDAEGVITGCEGAAADRIGLGDNVLGLRYTDALADAPALVAMIQTGPTDGPATVRERDFDVKLIPRGAGGYLVATDVTERVRLARELEHQATHDELTGLPNRALAVSRTDAAFAGGSLVAVIADLRAFDTVNETAGHGAGDALLRAIGRRLADELPDAIVGRTGGDEFTVVARGETTADALRLAAAVRASLGATVVIGGRTLTVEARCGVSVSSSDDDARSLLRGADSALQAARRGAGTVIVNDSEMAAAHRRRLELASDLRDALTNREIDVHFQPIVELASGRTVRVEALARWRHPRHGWVPPTLFVELAELTGLIGTLTEQILERALRGAAALGVPVSINVSGVDLQDSPLADAITRELDRHGFGAEMLGVEITESFRLEQEPGALAVLDGIRDLGVVIAIDDFGTGWSSLTLLERLPASILKLDRTYVGRAATDPSSLAIVRSATSLAHALNLLVVAEGIEDEATRHMLRELGCEIGQGFLFSKPLPLAELTQGSTSPRRIA